MLILSYGSKLYSGSDNDKIGPNTPKHQRAYAAYARVAAAHYRDRRVIWEIWNEPNTGEFGQPASSVEHCNSSHKPAYVAMQALNRHLGGYWE